MNHGATTDGPSAADRVTAEETGLMLGLLGRMLTDRSLAEDVVQETAVSELTPLPARTGPKVLVTAP